MRLVILTQNEYDADSYVAIPIEYESVEKLRADLQKHVEEYIKNCTECEEAFEELRQQKKSLQYDEWSNKYQEVHKKFGYSNEFILANKKFYSSSFVSNDLIEKEIRLPTIITVDEWYERG